jgi:hypothetical protein
MSQRPMTRISSTLAGSNTQKLGNLRRQRYVIPTKKETALIKQI